MEGCSGCDGGGVSGGYGVEVSVVMVGRPVEGVVEGVVIYSCG